MTASKAVKSFALLAILIIVAGIFFDLLAGNASNSNILDIFKTGKNLMKAAAGLLLPLAIYFVYQRAT